MGNPLVVVHADAVVLTPTYDFFSPLRPVAGPDGRPMGMSREPMLMGRDFTFKAYPTHIILGAGVQLDFLLDMQNVDKATYVSFLETVSNGIKEESARRSGIVLPGGPRRG